MSDGGVCPCVQSSCEEPESTFPSLSGDYLPPTADAKGDVSLGGGGAAAVQRSREGEMEDQCRQSRG